METKDDTPTAPPAASALEEWQRHVQDLLDAGWSTLDAYDVLNVAFPGLALRAKAEVARQSHPGPKSHS